MNKQALIQLENKCITTIAQWVKENWFRPLDIEDGNYIEHCRMYGDEDIQQLYEDVWDGAPEDDPEVQKALLDLERRLKDVSHYCAI